MKQHLLGSPFQIALEDSVTTCLSPSVYDMICTLGFELREDRDIDSIVTRDGTVCWGTITACVADAGPGLPLLRAPELCPCFPFEMAGV